MSMSFGGHAAAQVSYDQRSLEMGDVSKAGNESIPYENYKLDPDFGDKQSDCGTEAEDRVPFGPGSISGPHKYSCNKTLLAHDSYGVIHKFRAMVCRNGPTPEQARFKASAQSEQLVEGALADFRKLHDEPQLVTDRWTIKCKYVGLFPEEKPADQTAAQPAQPPAQAEHPDTVIFRMHNDDRRNVFVNFFAQSPYSGKYTLDLLAAGASQEQRISCSPGEKVCYGAERYDQNVSWGVGRLGDEGCTGCCLACGGENDFTLGDAGEDRAFPPAVFILHNADRYTLGVKFFSKMDSGTWPGAGQQYNLSGTQTYKLTCQREEKICFGAWRDYQTQIWGAGRDGNAGCDNCCIICGNIFETTINDGGADDYQSSGGSNTANAIGAAASIIGAFAGAAGHGGGGGVRTITVPRASSPPPHQDYYESGISK